jgi:type VI protein secretion system component VasF
MGTGIEANVYQPSRGFDPSLLVVFAMAVFSVAVGAFWSGHYRHNLYSKLASRLKDQKPRQPHPGVGDQQQAAAKAHKHEEEAVSIDLSPLTVFVLVAAMCLMLVLLYFFYSYLSESFFMYFFFTV